MSDIFRKIYLFLIPHNSLVHLPFLGAKFQLSELVFLPWLAYSLKNYRKILKENCPIPMDLVVLSWFAMMFVPLIAGNGSRFMLFEIAGSLYLVILYFLVRLSTTFKNIVTLERGFIYSALIAALIALAGWILFVAGIQTPLAFLRDYPYLGYVVQSRGLSNSPNMLAGFLSLAIIFQTARLISGKGELTGKDWVKGAILATGFVTTLSKAIFPLGIGLLAVFILKKRFSSGLKWNFLQMGIFVFSFLFFAFVYMVVTHFYLSKNPGQERIDEFKPGSYQYVSPVINFSFRGKTYTLVPTNYLVNKKAAFEALSQTRGIGVGAGNFNSFVAGLKAKGKYPAHYPDYSPHSSYTGALAENGVAGFVLLLAFCATLGYMALMNLKNAYSSLNLAIVGILVTIAIMALATDVMNFRHYWLVFGLVAAEYAGIKREEKRR